MNSSETKDFSYSPPSLLTWKSIQALDDKIEEDYVEQKIKAEIDASKVQKRGRYPLYSQPECNTGMRRHI